MACLGNLSLLSNAGDRKYVKIGDLSQGTFGFVQLARNVATQGLVAIKFLERNVGSENAQRTKLYWKREIVSHSNFCHPNIVQFHEVFTTPAHLAIAMEYAAGGTMLQHVNRKKGLSEDEARKFFQQLIIAVDYCHKMGVANRDIKMENTLLDETRTCLKLIDFGYCKSDNQSLPKSLVGTKGYTAPEIVTAKQKTYDGKAADIWSCGVVLYIMLFFLYPFERANDPPGALGLQKVLGRIAKVDYIIPPNRRVSPEAKDLLSRILVADPAQRLSIAGIESHPWFAQGLTQDLHSLNERCLRLDPHSQPGYQSVQEIEEVLQQAECYYPTFDFEDDNTLYDSEYASSMEFTEMSEPGTQRFNTMQTSESGY